MKSDPQAREKVRKKLDEALAGLQSYLKQWPEAPQDFTTENELKAFVAKLEEMRDSLDRGQMAPILGLWRIMETWPFKNNLRQQIVEAEYEYERLK
jgi:hypothetical protein